MNKGDFPDDTFTQSDVENELDRAGLKHYDKGRYILSQCPTHDDQHPSVQIYKDDWFVNCHATCGRYHITKAFPELRPHGSGDVRPAKERSSFSGQGKKVTERVYKTVDMTSIWEKMRPIPDDFTLHGVPAEVLNDMGWRLELGGDIFIPYFSASKQSIPFAQWRHSGGDHRFTMLKDAKPTCYGTWNLDNTKLFIVEGTSDCAVLDYAGVPWIGLPSAASTKLMQSMALYCLKNGIQLVYAGDNDAAGDKLREALEEVSAYRLKQPPKEYKDWGEFLEKAGIEAVREYTDEELYGTVLAASIPSEVTANWPAAEDIKLEDPFDVAGAENVRSNLKPATTLF